MLKSTHALVTVFVCILQDIIYMGFTRIFGIKTKVDSVVGNTHLSCWWAGIISCNVYNYFILFHLL